MATEITTKRIWSRKQQDALDALIREREEVMTENRKPLEELYKPITKEFPNLVDWTIVHAEQIRDLLIPFDGRVK